MSQISKNLKRMGLTNTENLNSSIFKEFDYPNINQFASGGINSGGTLIPFSL